MPKVTNLFLALMIVQLLLYGYILVLELPPRITRPTLNEWQEAVKVPKSTVPSSVGSLLGCTGHSTRAASALSEAEASEAFAPAAVVASPETPDPLALKEEEEKEEEEENALLELGHAFLDHMAQLHYPSSDPLLPPSS
jgi:hypothetical protein